MTSAPTVFVVDDNPGVRKSLQSLIESAGLAVETYPSSEAFLAAYDLERPGCLLLDLRLRGGSGFDLQDELRRRHATLPIIVVTAHGNVPSSVRALKGGALDFLRKPVAPTTLLARIREAIEIDRQARERALAHAALARRLRRLTPREHEVLDLLLAGRTSKQIATALRLSARTVEGHRRMILLKMGVTSTAALLRTVLRDGNVVSPT